MVNATIIGFIAKSCTQLLVGYYGDKINTSIGRRKPFLIISYFIKGFSIFMLTIPISHHGDAIFGWYILFFTLFQIGTEFSDGPFDAWMIESTKDDEDFRKIYSVSGPLGGFLGGICGLIFTLFFPIFGSIIYLIGGGIFTYLIVMFVTSQVIRKQPPLPDLIPSLRICSRTNEFFSIFYLKVLIDSGINIFVTVVGFYLLIGFNIHTVKAYINILLLGTIIGASIGIPLTIFMNWVLKKYDKIQIYLILIGTVVLLGFVAFFVISPIVNSFEGYFTILCLMNIISYPAKLFDRLIIKDLITYDTFITGRYLSLNFTPFFISFYPLSFNYHFSIISLILFFFFFFFLISHYIRI